MSKKQTEYHAEIEVYFKNGQKMYLKTSSYFVAEVRDEVKNFLDEAWARAEMM